MFTSGTGNYSAGDPATGRESGQNFTRRDARCHTTPIAFSAQGPHEGTPAFRLRTHHARHRAGRSSEGGGRREGQGEETTRRAPQRKKGRAKVRTARHKVCPLLWEACGAVRARTGVGTPFPLRLLAQTYALWRGVISEGLPSSELWETPYIIVYVYFGDRKLLRRGPHGGPLKWTTLYAAGCIECYGP